MTHSTYKGKGLTQITGVSSPNVAPATLDLSGSAGAQVSIFDILDSKTYHPKVKKYEIFESPEDPIALSIAWKKLRDQCKSPTGYLLNKVLFDYVTPDDRHQADIIRDYYSKKLMMLILKDDHKITPFRKDLNSYLHSNKFQIQENQMGLVYYLPTLYLYDIEIDSLKEKVNLNTDWKNQQIRERNTVKSLTAVSKITKERKNTNQVEYWFSDTNNSAVLISLEPTNPLLHMFDYVFDNIDKIEIFGNYYNCQLDNLNYYKIDKWKLVQT